MNYRFLATVFVLAVLLITQLEAASGNDLWNYYVIPAVARVTGEHGTFWRSDVSVVNPYSWRSIRVYMRFLAKEENNTAAAERSFSIGPGDSLLLEDIVSTVFGEDGNGAVELYTKDDSYFAVSSRVYTGSIATFGQTETAQDYFGGGLSRTIVTGVRQTSRFRANVGATNVSDRNISLEITAYDSSGSNKGRTVLSLPPYSQNQVAVRTFASNFDSGYVVFRCRNSGSNIYWTGYASVVDNESGDAVFLNERIDAQFTEYQPTYDLSGYWEGIQSAPQGSSDISVFIEQTGAELVAWGCFVDPWPGFCGSIWRGAIDGDQFVFDDVLALQPGCWGDEVSDAHGTAYENSISFFFDVSGDCADGTVTVTLTRQSAKSAKNLAAKMAPLLGLQGLHERRHSP